MNKFYKFLLFIALIYSYSLNAQSVRIATQIDGFRHNYDCCNDGISVGCILDNYPEPRYKVWVGYNDGSFSQYTNNPGLFCGSPNYTYGANGQACNVWDPGTITGPMLTGNATVLNIDMESWEEDEYGTPNIWPLDGCPHDNCNKNSNSRCANDDDVRCGRLRIGDINFMTRPPCTDYTYTGAFNSGSFLSMHDRCSDNGGDYGIDKLIVNWSFNEAPTITRQPTDVTYGGTTREVCTGLPLTLTVISNVKTDGSNTWTLGRWVKWQSASSPSGPWSNISGTLNTTAYTTETTFNYNFTPNTAGTTYYRAVLSSACPNTFTTFTTNSSVVTVIAHDAASDPYCTAPQCDIAYVDPSIASNVGTTGTPANPYKYVSSAVASGMKYVRIAKGSGTDPGIVNLTSNVVVEGGYVRSGTSGELWTKSSNSADKSSITFSGKEAISGVRHTVAFKSNGASGWTVKDLDIITANASTTVDASKRGESNYGFLIINNSSNYNIIRCNIALGNGGKGQNGTYSSTAGGGAAGSSGGTGSNGHTGNCGTSNSVSAGNAGTGGTGAAATINTSNTGAQGTKGTGGAGYGTDNSGCIISCGNRNGNNGTNGGTGGAGGSWAVGNRPTSPVPTNSAYYTPAVQSNKGGNGGGGGGGGGGSGSRGGEVGCVNCDGFKGANGEAGRTGGAGGQGGYGGGGVFGIWRNNSNTGANIQQVNVSLGTAGLGGNGVNGRPGQAASSAAPNGSCNGCVNQRCSGKGGKGGAGGQGGRGRDGANGYVAAMVVNGAVTATLTYSIPYPATITLDNFSQRNNVSGKMCNNSEIDMAKTSGTWSLPAGLTYIKNLTPTTTSYSNATNSVKVATSNFNAFYNISNGTSLLNYLYVANQNRNLPSVAISPITKVVCKGSSVDIASSNSYDIGNVQQYDFVIYKDGSNANSPYSSGSYNSTASSYSTPVFTETGKYWVKYRERHNCCGWSAPVYDAFEVIDVPNAPTAINIIGGPYCYTGSPQSFTINVTGTKAFSAYDSWELFDEDPTIGTPTAIQTSTNNNPTFGVTPTQTTTYYVRGKNQCGVSSALSVTAYISGDQTTDGVLATTTSSKTCVVNDNLWHYFRNTAGEIIAAINSNGQNLGNVTMTVTIENNSHGTYDSPEHGNGGLGHGGDCFGLPELSMRRWYTITPTNQPTAGNPSSIRLFFTNADYANYTSELVTWDVAHTGQNSYGFCYGSTSSEGDLVVSKDELLDVFASSVAISGGPNNSTQYELAIPSFSTFRFHTNGGIGGPLPVELLSFTGHNEGERNKLEWITASEINTKVFIIEKSTDLINWFNIGHLDAAGYSYDELSYIFYDNSPNQGNNYYRLKIIDLDASFEYSDVINIPIAKVTNTGIVNVYPNPTTNDINIVVSSADNQNASFQIFDILGKQMLFETKALNAGLNTLNYNVAQFAKGAYIIKVIDANGKTYQRKFVKD